MDKEVLIDPASLSPLPCLQPRHRGDYSMAGAAAPLGLSEWELSTSLFPLSIIAFKKKKKTQAGCFMGVIRRELKVIFLDIYNSPFACFKKGVSLLFPAIIILIRTILLRCAPFFFPLVFLS